MAYQDEPKPPEYKAAISLPHQLDLLAKGQPCLRSEKDRGVVLGYLVVMAYAESCLDRGTKSEYLPDLGCGQDFFRNMYQMVKRNPNYRVTIGHGCGAIFRGLFICQILRYLADACGENPSDYPGILISALVSEEAGRRGLAAKVAKGDIVADEEY